MRNPEESSGDGDDEGAVAALQTGSRRRVSDPLQRTAEEIEPRLPKSGDTSSTSSHEGAAGAGRQAVERTLLAPRAQSSPEDGRSRPACVMLAILGVAIALTLLVVCFRYFLSVGKQQGSATNVAPSLIQASPQMVAVDHQPLLRQHVKAHGVNQHQFDAVGAARLLVNAAAPLAGPFSAPAPAQSRPGRSGRFRSVLGVP
uniref:Uncharacterized protein n=1 Tax=Zooxanthella nutricula TaxID=1333877 RepID=A0A6U6HQP4_9DINO